MKFERFDLEPLFEFLLECCDRLRTNDQVFSDEDGLSDERLPSFREFENCSRMVRFVDPTCSSTELEQIFERLLKLRSDVAKPLINYIKSKT